MINRRHRFHGLNALRFVYQHGQTARGPLLSLKYHSNRQRDTYRLAVVVSKKVNKSAAVRNRIRRRIYEHVRLQESLINGPYDLVITVFNEQVATMPVMQLSPMIDALLQQAGILTTSGSSHGKI